MDSPSITQTFLALVLLSTAVQAGLARRQMRHVARHRVAAPALLQKTVPLESHQKAADDTLVRVRFGLVRLGVTLVLMLPLAALSLWLLGAAGPAGWRWAWGAYLAFTLLLVAIFPTLIAPLFNRYEPLADATLAERAPGLMDRCGFASRGLLVMERSRRSAKSNACFTGLGRARRVGLCDTLIAQLTRGELLAVLAHELGHFRLRHIPKQLGISQLAALAVFAALGWLAAQRAFCVGLGTPPVAGLPTEALALVLFIAAAGFVGVLFSPPGALFSQGLEFEAHAYAATHADGGNLAMALVKLYRENLGTLTPDPVYWRFYASHPTVLERLSRLPQPQPTRVAHP
jgi:STE24 endopeptidase